jgi:Tol biopolymer transport system component
MAAADGSSHDDLVLLADHSATDQCAGWPAWSPDGKWIAYHLGEGDSEEEDEGKAIWLVDPVTKQKRLLVEGPAGQDVCGPTSWSPNSRYLSFKMDPDGNDSLRALYLVEVANGSILTLTEDHWDYRHWFSPSGAAILFRDAGSKSVYCQSSRDGCENGSDLLVLNLRDAGSFLGDEGIGRPIPATTPAGLITLALLIAALGAFVVVRRST